MGKVYCTYLTNEFFDDVKHRIRCNERGQDFDDDVRWNSREKPGNELAPDEPEHERPRPVQKEIPETREPPGDNPGTNDVLERFGQGVVDHGLAFDDHP